MKQKQAGPPNLIFEHPARENNKSWKCSLNFCSLILLEVKAKRHCVGRWQTRTVYRCCGKLCLP